MSSGAARCSGRWIRRRSLPEYFNFGKNFRLTVVAVAACVVVAGVRWEHGGAEDFVSPGRLHQSGCGNGQSICLGNLTMHRANSGLDNHSDNQSRVAHSGACSNQSGATAANWRTKGKIARSVAHASLPPRKSLCARRCSNGRRKCSSACSRWLFRSALA